LDVKAVATAIRQQVGAALAGSGVEVEDVVIHPAGKRRLVRVTVARDVSDLDPADQDSPVEPATLDEVAEATRTVSDVLDSSELMGRSPYTLEVSSPGVDHPLTTPAQFRRNVGRLLAVRLAEGAAITSRLLAAGPDGIRLADDPGRTLPLDQIAHAKVEVEFTRPGSGKD
jgi:ribosome maturation factor RimP